MLHLVLKTPPRVKANTVPVPQWLLQSQRIHEGKIETEMGKTVSEKKGQEGSVVCTHPGVVVVVSSNNN